MNKIIKLYLKDHVFRIQVETFFPQKIIVMRVKNNLWNEIILTYLKVNSLQFL